MMLDTRLFSLAPRSMRFVALSVFLQWLALLVNIAMIGFLAMQLERLWAGDVGLRPLVLYAGLLLCGVAVRG
ncbi:MAG: cysteine ABC transporter ATP-binding protein, partial [Coriobacteriales bacterium]|nr:cysteine ABC transporter ATP-binding protein [Coriobacteriales bacterium]